MARGKQTARKSTGGKAHMQLVTEVLATEVLATEVLATEVQLVASKKARASASGGVKKPHRSSTILSLPIYECSLVFILTTRQEMF
jgi:hypothetical protein